MSERGPLPRFFVTGNGTDVGKTIVSAILTQALQSDYWKPIQAGNLDLLDSSIVAGLVSNSVSRIHPERYTLTEPMSPHAAAHGEGITISINDFVLPETENGLVIEGAGGVMVPLNREKLLIDLIEKLKAPVIFVSRHYLGSINHTLLSLEALKRRKIAIHGIIFVGDPTPDSETIITTMSGVRMLGRIAWEDELSPLVIAQYARLLREVL